MEHEKQNGILTVIHNGVVTPKRSRSPSPNEISRRIRTSKDRSVSKMPKFRQNPRQTRGSLGSLSEDENADSAVFSTTQSEENNLVLRPKGSTLPATPAPRKVTIHKTSSYGTIEESLDSGALKKKISSLFKSAARPSPVFKRQDSDYGYHSQNSPVSTLANQDAFSSHVTNGGLVHRDLSIEEELEIRLNQLSEVTRQWKTRWRQERDTNSQLQEQFFSCERQCCDLIDNLQETYEERIAGFKAKLKKRKTEKNQLSQQKYQLETELKKVITEASAESCKFRSELECVQAEVAKLHNTRGSLWEENNQLQAALESMKADNHKLEMALREVTEDNNNIQVALEDRKQENKKLRDDMTAERMRLSDGLKVTVYESQSKLKAVELETELYKSLLDIALNKLKLLEDHVQLDGDVRRRKRDVITERQNVMAMRQNVISMSARRDGPGNSHDVTGERHDVCLTPTRCLSTENADVTRRPISRGRYVIRVNQNDPTDMCVEDTLLSGSVSGSLTGAPFLLSGASSRTPNSTPAETPSDEFKLFGSEYLTLGQTVSDPPEGAIDETDFSQNNQFGLGPEPIQPSVAVVTTDEPDLTSGGSRNNPDVLSISSDDMVSNVGTDAMILHSESSLTAFPGTRGGTEVIQSADSPLTGEEWIRSVEISVDAREGLRTNSQPVRRQRALSDGEGQGARSPSEIPDSVIRAKEIGSPPRQRASMYGGGLPVNSGFMSSIGQLVKASSESLMGSRPSSRSSRSRESTESLASKIESVDSETSIPEEVTNSRMSTLKELKRKRPESVKVTNPSHEATLQKLHRYRSVGDLLRGITGDKRKASRDEVPSIVVDSSEDLNNNNNKEKVVQPLIKSRTRDREENQAKVSTSLHRRTTSHEVLPSGEKIENLSREPSDVSTGSHDVTISKSSSTDDVAGTRTSGFVALRTRRNGMTADPGDFKDISKQLRKRQKGGGGVAGGVTDIWKRLSRDTPPEEYPGAEGRHERRRSKNK